MEYIEYIKEIERLKKIYGLSISQILMLQIAAAFEVDNLNYRKLKEEFCKK